MAEDERTLHIRQGYTYRVSFDWQTNNGTPISLTGYTIWIRILDQSGHLPALIELDSTGDQIVKHPGGVTGRAQVTLTAAQTAALRRSGVYAVGASLTGSDEPVEYVASGPFALIKMGA